MAESLTPGQGGSGIIRCSCHRCPDHCSRPAGRVVRRRPALVLIGLILGMMSCSGGRAQTLTPTADSTQAAPATGAPAGVVDEVAITLASPSATPDRTPDGEPADHPEANTSVPTLPPTDTPTPFPITLDLPASPTAEPMPLAEIRINAPGPLSRVSTPLHLSALLAPGAGGKVRLELLGEDGRLLARNISQHTTNPGQRINLVLDIDFEITAVAETGTVVLSVDDSYGRTTDLASVEVILLGEGSSDINPAGDQLAPIIIQEPAAKAKIQGGNLTVSGLARPATDLPLAIELITRDGKVVGSRLAAVEEGPAGEHRPFFTVVPYMVGEPTPALLIIRERSSRFPGTIQLVSQELTLEP